MENLLLPIAAAGAVFVICLLLLMRVGAPAENKRKRSLLGKITEDSKNVVISNDYEYQLLKDSSKGFFARLPIISTYYDLLQKADMWQRRGTLFVKSVIIFLVLLFVLRKLGLVGVLGALVLTHLISMHYLKKQIRNHAKKFIDTFPDAIDMIVRSVRSGHPLNTAMRMIAENMESPIREEFRKVIDEVSYGMSLPDALRRMAERIPEPDVNFFVVVLSVQQETGGSLTEVLSNLSNLIRKRKQLRAKIRALTSEGRATSYILGAIPLVEFGALYYITPAYIEVLFNTFAGNILLAIATGLIIASQITVRAMINIDI